MWLILWLGGRVVGTRRGLLMDMAHADARKSSPKPCNYLKHPCGTPCMNHNLVRCALLPCLLFSRNARYYAPVFKLYSGLRKEMPSAVPIECLQINMSKQCLTHRCEHIIISVCQALRLHLLGHLVRSRDHDSSLWIVDRFASLCYCM